MRIEGEKGVKTQSAPKHWPRTRKRIWPSNSNRADRTVEPGRNGSLGRISIARQNRSRGRTNQEETGRDRPNLYRNGPTVPVDPGNKRSASAEISRHDLADQIARPRQNPSAIGPKLFGQGKSPFH
ncbi:unnamed protein product [Microthlaspi erraticum]|uniref:Uncharacterized protein n=1 Tax=Microthlaspi erraticum TaxID=1685480 RepID=A0A6D2ISW1_9BRAS|nr:unnamed protein product [Microthlaspi erraticum]